MGLGLAHRRSKRAVGVLTAAFVLVAIGGCRTPLPLMGARAGSYEYFSAPLDRDAWSRKIRGWQAREKQEGTVHATASPGPAHPGLERVKVGDLRDKYDAFRRASRRALARDVSEWIQEQARDHYVPDGPVDHWATFEETLATNGDDCDGLELLTFYFLRELGFPEDEVFRAIVVRREDGQHHMVTLWFEDRDDPWVIDPTGAMTSGMPRMSEVPGWMPLKVFTDARDFTVRDRELIASSR